MQTISLHGLLVSRKSVPNTIAQNTKKVRTNVRANQRLKWDLNCYEDIENQY